MNNTVVCITGSKGKTLITRAIAEVEKKLSRQESILHVDSTGSYCDLQQISTRDDSIINYGTAPNVRPGRYLRYLKKISQKDIWKIILECSYGCSKSGTGVKEHSVGIFTNLYSTDINFKTISTKDEMYKRKSFVFKNITNSGIYITSIDYLHTRKSLCEKVLSKKSVRKFAITTKKHPSEMQKKYVDEYELEDLYFINQSGKICTYKRGLTGHKVAASAEFEIENMLYIYAYFDCQDINIDLSSIVDAIPESYGRSLNLIHQKTHLRVEYAHDPDSLKLLIKSEVKPFHLVIRFSPYLVNYKQYIDKYIDILREFHPKITMLTIFDVIDGNPIRRTLSNSNPKKIGETSQIMYEEIIKLDLPLKTNRLLNEQDALSYAINRSNRVIHIHNKIEDVIKVWQKFTTIPINSHK